MVQYMMYLVWGGQFMVPNMDLCIYIMDHKVVPSGAREVLGMVGQDRSESKSNQLHVDIFRFCFIYLRRYILQILLK